MLQGCVSMHFCVPMKNPMTDKKKRNGNVKYYYLDLKGTIKITLTFKKLDIENKKERKITRICIRGPGRLKVECKAPSDAWIKFK